MSAVVEAAARAWFDRGQAQRLDAGRKRDDGLPWQWEDLTEDDRVGYRAIVQPVVEAAVAAERDRIADAVLEQLHSGAAQEKNTAYRHAAAIARRPA